MQTLKQKSYCAKPQDQKRQWYIIDASHKVLGRLSTELANVIRGKNKPTFTPHVDCGDFVVVTNAQNIKLTGKKWTDKMYYDHSKHVGGLKAQSAKAILQRNPRRLIYDAVKGMLPYDKLADQMIKKLKIYKGTEHPHQAQTPIELKLP